MVRIQSHISQVELESTLLLATAGTALIILLAALAPEVTRTFCGVTGTDWCTEAGLVDKDETRLCRPPVPVELDSGTPCPLG